MLGLCGECVVSLSAAQRAICVQRAISIITEKTGISVESILLHPHRVRYWMLLTDSCTHGLSKAGNSRGSGISAMDCIRTPEGCRGLVMRHLRCDDTPNIPGNNSEDGSTSCPSGDHSLTLRVSSYLKFSAQELVPWESVTDLALRVSALSDLSTPFDEDDTAGSSSSSAASRRLTCRRRHLASVKRRRVQCGLDVSNLSRTQTDATNESDTTWMLLGASMVAEQVLSTLTTSSSEAVNASHSGMTAAERELEASRGASYRFPRVYSPEHLWEVFYPHMLVLLKAPALAAAEGLALMCHLGECAAVAVVLYQCTFSALISTRKVILITHACPLRHNCCRQVPLWGR